MATSVSYFSAEVIGPNLRRPFSVVRIRNRKHPSTFTDYQWKKLDAHQPDSLNAQLRAIYHSPVLKVEALWHDEYLGLFFYRVMEEV